MFRKVSRWLTDKGDQFVRGGGQQEMQGEAANGAELEAEERPVIDPFGHGDQKYGGRQPYRSRAELEAEAAQQAQQQAQQEAEAYQAQMQAQYQAQQEAMQQNAGYQAQGYAQQPQYQQQEAMQQTGAYQAQGYAQQPQYQQQEAMQQTGAYQAQGYAQQPQYQQQEAMQQNAGYQAQGYAQQPQYQQQEAMQQTGAYQAQGYAQQPQYQQQEAMQQTGAYQAQGYAQQPQYQQPQQSVPGSNVLTFPGMQSTPDGVVYAHVEHIVQLCRRDECRRVIDYIRSNASVFLNMEMIANANERQRCVDMLSGAAYALNCTLSKISPRGVYLISSPSVRVMMDPATQKIAATPEVRSFARQSYGQEAAQPRYTAPAQYAPAEEEEEEAPQTGGFSSGSPTQRFQSQGAQGMSVSFGTAMAGSHTGMHRAINAQRYNAQ